MNLQLHGLSINKFQQTLSLTLQLFDQVTKMTDIETVPQVFIDETFVGGYPDVKMLHERRYIHEMLLPKPGVSVLF